MSNLELTNYSYSDRPSHEIVISSISNQKLNTLKDYHNRGLNVQTGNVKEVTLVGDEISSKHLINGFRGGNLTIDSRFKLISKTGNEVKLTKLSISRFTEYDTICFYEKIQSKEIKWN